MQQVQLTNWEFLILINLTEKEWKHTSGREFEKRNALLLLKNKLQAISMGPKPFPMQVSI
ncbi:hypothetical protein MUP77_22735 [Candidatus Bathyarchaeota archaeon]|nr:hypothetical protein [Candidatus Bathyarchaeota archaeon]